MNETTAQRKRREKAEVKAHARARVYLPLPEEFLDVDGEDGWSVLNGEQNMGLDGVLLHTLRRAPVETGEDAERVLDIREAIKATGDDAAYMALDQSDFEWMMKHLKKFAHRVWLAPDAAYLCRYLNKSMLKSPPREPSNGVAEEIPETVEAEA
ncbi:hypothetical protein CMI37_20320 [Candidatus Pacearchaeota archaeon]|nr:hypothetical protein [Candidatus Pacearchaeota archaeon]|tara:strand:+ start:6855 stop:7316 length:462 start_codon:yes stop_codon:yes gene_type:complete